MSGAWWPDDLHEGAGLRSRDQRGGGIARGLFLKLADHAYSIPGTTHDRRCIVYERLAGEASGSRSRTSLREATLSAEFAGTAREITSASNPTFQRCRDLLSGPGIRKHGDAILSGMRVCSEVLSRFPEQVVAWMTNTHHQPPPTSTIEWLRFSEPLFKELDVVGTHAPLLLVRVPAIAVWNDADAWPLGCTLFVPFQDPENIGAVIRSAAAFGVARVVLLREAAHPFHHRSARAAGPALFQVRLEQGPALEDLRVASVPLIALDTTGPELSDAPFPDTFGLVVGVEGPGLPSSLRQCQRRRIEMQPGVESLNAATAAAIALYVWSRRC